MVRVGDRVRINERYPECTGLEGEVVSIIPEMSYPINVVTDEDEGYLVKFNEIEVIDPHINTLIIIGYTGGKRAYLNVSREEAIDRYIKSDTSDAPKEEIETLVVEFDFEDEFMVYDAYPAYDPYRERCNECGRSVASDSGYFVNRVPDISMYEERREMGKPFPMGEFICRECDVRED